MYILITQCLKCTVYDLVHVAIFFLKSNVNVKSEVLQSSASATSYTSSSPTTTGATRRPGITILRAFQNRCHVPINVWLDEILIFFFDINIPMISRKCGNVVILRQSSYDFTSRFGERIASRRPCKLLVGRC